ncbi:Dimer Tnp hAT domain-containing protein [Aphis craccivora]|uniref:Dimer Tnp hAT domain-containing protein n=1 Tax=Aphis craccivora TaxID=307492 RepID=A0A6G0YKD9_APHCR|nr:Dimer Tnp hAT domain-containing protein [Aphis craccivora]
MCFPHANADCERAFSAVNGVKTKFRNRLVTDFISGVLHSKQLIKTLQ